MLIGEFMNKELYELMENILYNEIIPECKLGNLMIGDINPAISFTAPISSSTTTAFGKRTP